MTQPQPDIFSQIASRFFDIFVLILGALLGYVSSWMITKGERKEARADQRRERIFGPLHDELDNLELMISKTEDVATINTVYDKVRAEHIRYMIPTKLRVQIIQLYEEMLPAYASVIHKLREKYLLIMYKSLCTDLGLLSTSSNFVRDLAGLSYWLLQGKFPRNMLKDIETAIVVMKEDSKTFLHANWQEYFEYWKNQIRNDTEFKEFEQFRTSIIAMIQEINGTIRKDLESEN
jgi:hypothetical protein